MTTLESTHPIRRAGRALVAAAAWGLFALDALALVGFAARDRRLPLALMMYLPLLPLGLATLAFDLAMGGRGGRGPRWGLSALGLVAVGCSAATMIGRGPASSATPGGDELRVLHWNVLWGGRTGADSTWRSIEDDILRRIPDVVILSEAPTTPRLVSLGRRLGAGWSSACIEHEPASPYWYRLAVYARWPIRDVRRVAIRNGVAMTVEIDRPGGPLRLLVVDGRSTITELRSPMLRDVAATCIEAEARGVPYDLIAGDFNAPSRSVGFDALRPVAGGYRPAASESTGWRGTWPLPAPVYDIDHVWIRRGLGVVGCSLFSSRNSDHRGQVVRLRVPRE